MLFYSSFIIWNLAYILMVSIFWSMTSFYLLMFLMELNLLFFVMICLKVNLGFNVSSSEMIFSYFCYQMIFSMGFFYSLFICSSNFFATENYNMDLIISLVLLMKLGFFPFFTWLYKMIKVMNNLTMFFMSTLQKLMGLMFLKKFFTMNLNFFMIFNMMMGSIMINKAYNLKFLIFGSSMMNLFWFMNMLIFNYKIFFVFFLLYSLILALILLNENMNLNLNYSMEKTFLIMLVCSFFLSVPPLSSFFLKIYLIFEIYSHLSTMMLMILSVCVIMGIFGYMKFFYIFIFNNLNFYFLTPLKIFDMNLVMILSIFFYLFF